MRCEQRSAQLKRSSSWHSCLKVVGWLGWVINQSKRKQKKAKKDSNLSIDMGYVFSILRCIVRGM